MTGPVPCHLHAQRRLGGRLASEQRWPARPAGLPTGSRAPAGSGWCGTWLQRLGLRRECRQGGKWRHAALPTRRPHLGWPAHLVPLVLPILLRTADSSSAIHQVAMLNSSNPVSLCPQPAQGCPASFRRRLHCCRLLP